MQPECIPAELAFEGLGRRRVVGRFDGGRLTTDGGVLLLRELDRRTWLTERLAGCLRDHRSAARIEHRVQTLIAQRVLGLAAGYEDLNDHDRLRADSVLALASGCADVTGDRRRRAHDCGQALAGSSTLNRLELSVPDTATGDRYKRIAADLVAMDALLVDLFLEAHPAPPPGDRPRPGRDRRSAARASGGPVLPRVLPVVLLPAAVRHLRRLHPVRLARPANIDALAGSVAELRRIVAQIRAAWPPTRILVRDDAGFCRDDLMAWCEEEGLDYVFGLARNPRLQRWLAKALRKSRRRCAATGTASRRFRERRWRTRPSWSWQRRVVGKAERLPGLRGDNPRFVVTNLPPDQVGAQQLYEAVYCVRGEMENRIKERQLWLFEDRTSTATMRANQLRLTFATFAAVLITLLRQVGLPGTALAGARADTIRDRLLKVAARVTVSQRRIRIAFPSVYPLQAVFGHVLAAPRAPPARAGPG